MAKAKEIETVEELEQAYPDLVAEIRETADVIEDVKELEQAYPELIAQIKAAAIETVTARPAALSIPGFLIDVDDPFGAGTARDWGRLKKGDPPRLPFVLPYKDPDTAEALDNYILRAAGGGDAKRATAAGTALAKVDRKAKQAK